MKKQYLECGRIVSTHGVRGEVKVEPWCDSPDFLLDFDAFYVGKEQKEMQVEGARVHKTMVLLKLCGVDTPEQGMALRGKMLFIDRSKVSLEEGEYFVQDLIGLSVYDADDGRLYGRLVEVSQTGANDVYHIRFEDGKIGLVPKIPQVVLGIDIEGGRMEIRPLPGLFEEGTDEN